MMIYFVYMIVISRRKKTVGIILNQNKTVEKTVVFNPSNKKFETNNETYIVSEPPFIKYKNLRFVLYEKGNTEPLPILKDQDDRRINADLIHELLKMEKIRALNTPKKGLFDLIDKKYVFIGLIVIVAIIVIAKGGVI